MKKVISINIFKVNFKFRFIEILIYSLIYFAGICVAVILKINPSENICSPLTALYLGEKYLGIFLHSFLYFYFFVLIGIFLATSYFGFLFDHMFIFIKGIFSCLTIMYLIEQNTAFIITFTYIVLLTIEIFILIIFYIQTFNLSITAIKENSHDISKDFLGQIYIIIISMSILATILLILQKN